MSSNRKDSWTGDWCKKKLIEHDEVTSIDLTNTNRLLVTLKTGQTLTVATMSLSKINLTEVENLLNGQEYDFILNVFKEPYITRKALEYAENHNFAIGGLGDAMRGFNEGSFQNYLNPEIKFILRGLRQHSRVVSVVRLDNRRFQIERHGQPSVKILALNDYDLVAENVRNALDQFSKFDAILKSNPNGKITTKAITAADAAGIKIYDWGGLLGALNISWT